MSLDSGVRLLKDAYPQYDIGEGSYGGLTVLTWDDKTKLKVGKYCSFAFETMVLLGGEHRTDWVTTYPFSALWPEAQKFEGHPRSKGDVVIGNDVWVGAGAKILSGVTIGDGAVIGAGAVVAHDVEAYTIASGAPAKLISVRFPVIEAVEWTYRRDRLLRLAWWDWPREKIVAALPLMLDSKIDAFLEWAEAQ